ncbi:MAG: protein kinase [Bryobacterales bacterium]|nr:protein kinase [Bryobacterales bacterium]
MTAERWQRLKLLFSAVKELHTHEPDAVVQQHNLGSETRSELNSLIKEDGCAGDFLIEPAARLPIEHTTILQHGQLLNGQFLIEALIGAGGMGEVYSGRDTRLDRRVAIKVLSPHLLHDPGYRLRLLAEARNIAALSHPNICSILHLGGEHDLDYLVLELLEGETLAERIRRGPLPIPECRAIASQIIGALACAHAHEIIHRDLKPANVFLTPTGAKLLDFGLAKRHASLRFSADPETIEGKIAGTIPYMSPEQAEGKSVDHRSDIFSFGCVLYEMVSGRPAFSGDSPMATLAAVLRADPPELRRLNPSVPLSWEKTIGRCLAKDPASRPQSILEVQSALSAWSTSRRGLLIAGAAVPLSLVALSLRHSRAPSSPRDSLIVIPFTNLTQDPESDYLADGISDAVINALSRQSALRVIARSTSFTYKSQALDVPGIARNLKVEKLITGAVSRRNDDLRIQADLLDARGSQLWGHQYHGSVREVLNLQSQIVRDLSDRFQLSSATSSQGTENPEAYQLYLRGRYAMNRGSVADFKRAFTFFDQALALDPGFGAAYAGISDTFWSRSGLDLPAVVAMPKALAAANRALSLRPDLPEALCARGIVRCYFEFDLPSALSDLSRAVAMDPNNAMCRFWHAWALVVSGDFSRGLAEAQQAFRSDPLSHFIETGLGQMYYFARRVDAAIEVIENVRRASPNFFFGALYLGVAYIHAGRFEDAIPHLEQALQIDPGPIPTRAFLAYAHGRLGRRHTAEEFTRQVVDPGKTAWAAPYYHAIAYLGVNNHEAALQALQQAYEVRDDSLVNIGIESIFDPLSDEPRFLALLDKLGFSRTRPGLAPTRRSV